MNATEIITADDPLSVAGKFIVRDDDNIRPDRPIPQQDIDEVIQLHEELLNLPKSSLEKAMKIGFKLRCWHDVIPHGKWMKWCELNIPGISSSASRRYIQLWDNQEIIWSEFKLLQRSNSDELPTITWALGLCRKKESPSKPEKIKSTATRKVVDVEVVRVEEVKQVETVPNAEPDREIVLWATKYEKSCLDRALSPDSKDWEQLAVEFCRS